MPTAWTKFVLVFSVAIGCSALCVHAAESGSSYKSDRFMPARRIQFFANDRSAPPGVWREMRAIPTADSDHEVSSKEYAASVADAVHIIHCVIKADAIPDDLFLTLQARLFASSEQRSVDTIYFPYRWGDRDVMIVVAGGSEGKLYIFEHNGHRVAPPESSQIDEVMGVANRFLRFENAGNGQTLPDGLTCVGFDSELNLAGFQVQKDVGLHVTIRSFGGAGGRGSVATPPYRWFKSTGTKTSPHDSGG